MKTEPSRIPCLPPWGESFPRLSEIYTASDRTSPGNWFRLPNVWRGLLDGGAGLHSIEDDLQVLDPGSWAVFHVKATSLVHLMDKWGYSRALFDCFNEIKGYRYLLQTGYQQVRFVPENRKIRTPDLQAGSESSTVLMEVKSINESTYQKNYFEIPAEERIALDSENRVSHAFKSKLTETIGRAQLQLFAMRDSSVKRRIVFLVIRPDFNVHAEQELATFLEGQNTSEVEVVHHLVR